MSVVNVFGRMSQRFQLYDVPEASYRSGALGV